MFSSKASDLWKETSSKTESLGEVACDVEDATFTCQEPSGMAVCISIW